LGERGKEGLRSIRKQCPRKSQRDLLFVGSFRGLGEYSIRRNILFRLSSVDRHLTCLCPWLCGTFWVMLLLNSFGHGSGIAESDGNSMFGFLRNHQTIFQRWERNDLVNAVFGRMLVVRELSGTPAMVL
jgi:hypothetical protein